MNFEVSEEIHLRFHCTDASNNKLVFPQFMKTGQLSPLAYRKLGADGILLLLAHSVCQWVSNFLPTGNPFHIDSFPRNLYRSVTELLPFCKRLGVCPVRAHVPIM